jgi:hypothetical protein
VISDIEGLTRRQVAELGLLIGEAGYRAEDFDSGDELYVGPNTEPGIVHRPTRSTFAFGRHRAPRGYSRPLADLGFQVQFAPGHERPSDQRGPLDWNAVKEVFRSWLLYIGAESGAMDFATAVHAAKNSSPIEPDPRAAEPFAPLEQTAISDQLARMEATLRQIVERQSALDVLVQSEFASLRDELKRMQRGRWKTMVMGSLGSLVTHGIPPETVNLAWSNLEHFLDQLPKMLKRG